MNIFLVFFVVMSLSFIIKNNGYAEEMNNFLVEKQIPYPNCFLVHNFKTNENILQIGDGCDQASTPASTFKIPNSIIALDSQVVANPDVKLPWDGTKKTIPTHEQDHSLKTAMRDSVVWYYQRLAQKVGEARYKKYLNNFSYGNQDISGGLTQFWLGSSLQVTPRQQLEFLKKLYRNTLSVSSYSMEQTRLIMEIPHVFPAPWRLAGKTGSGTEHGMNVGWFVGYLTQGDSEYVFVSRWKAKGSDYKINGQYAGLQSKYYAGLILDHLLIQSTK
jgi:beta-lactamase class D